jgi:phosphate transport system permease protein
VGEAKISSKFEGEADVVPPPTPNLPSCLVRRLLLDSIAKFFVTCGGYFVILSILAIVVVIVAEVVPLFAPVTLSPQSSYPSGLSLAAEKGLNAVVLDEYREIATVVDGGRSEVRSYRIASARVSNLAAEELKSEALSTKVIPLAEGEKITSLSQSKSGAFLLGTSQGALLPLTVEYSVRFEGDERKISPIVSFDERIEILDRELERETVEEELLSEEVDPTLSIVKLAHTPSRNVIVAHLASGRTILRTESRRRSLMGPGKVSVSLADLEIPSLGSSISELNLSSSGELLIGGSEGGVLFAADIRGGESGEFFTIENEKPIRATALLLGDQTLTVGDTGGGVYTYGIRRDMSNKRVALSRRHTYDSHTSPVVKISVSSRNKTFTSLAENGDIAVHYGTSGQTLTDVSLGSDLVDIALSRKSDGVITLSREGEFGLLTLNNPHPEATFKTLFLPVEYEGLDESELIWQSTGGSDEFEPKLSITPLLFGTLKGTAYALLFSVPIAVLAALYTSQFMPIRVKRVVKPTVELMAALPSVVIGFIGGLWLAPRLDGFLLAVFIFPISLIVSSLIAMKVWKRFSPNTRMANWAGGPIVFLLLSTFFGLAAAVYFGSAFEEMYFGGDIQSALRSSFGIVYDQRNSIVVGIAMGFAVVPIIFTISEDCLSSVPRGLIAASLALGANRWQTALKVVLPSASPGIFSAVMIGFGRAIGETMIVLMATGNTPLIDISAFNGFRAMSANIAVELPEAPHGGTLYRILFLTAFLLFIFTFMVNTFSEFVRMRLRKKYEAG